MSEIAWAFFMDDIPADLTQTEKDELSDLRWDYFNEHRAADLWREHRAQIVEAWAAAHPGTRPGYWWDVESTEPRRRLGGTGTPRHERLAYMEHYVLGVPAGWIMQHDIDIYRQHLHTDLGVPALDPADPPVYESEAAYLDRLGLWLPGERRRVDKEDFEPESILDIFEFDADEP
jgi:hypothetical protein